MPYVLLMMIIGLPLLEIAGFVAVGERIGAGWTVAATVATAGLGLLVVRLQGIGLARRARELFARDEPPLAETIEALALGIAGVFLFIPGFFSDGLGAALLVPPIRAGLVWLLLSRLKIRVERHRQGEAKVIEGEFRDVTDKDGEGGGR